VCTVVDTGDGQSCIQDTAGDYEINQDCTFTFTGAGTVTRAEWGMYGWGCGDDYLQVNGGTKYCDTSSSGSALPASMQMAGTSTSFSFLSGENCPPYGASCTGFKLCAPVGCVACPASKYQPAPGSPSCLDCPAGHAFNATDCTGCPAGKYSATGVHCTDKEATWARLKAAVESTPSGSSVTFVLSPNFNCSDYSGEITISTGKVTVIGDSTIICDAAQGGRFFSVVSGAQLNLNAMTLKNGFGDKVKVSMLPSSNEIVTSLCFREEPFS
jgi:hypothetical protein